MPFVFAGDAVRSLSSDENPTGWLLALLLTSVGLPFFVVATTAPGTLLVLSCGSEDVDAWLDTLSSLATREMRKTGGLRRWRGGGLTGDDSAA